MTQQFLSHLNGEEQLPVRRTDVYIQPWQPTGRK